MNTGTSEEDCEALIEWLSIYSPEYVFVSEQKTIEKTTNF